MIQKRTAEKHVELHHYIWTTVWFADECHVAKS